MERHNRDITDAAFNILAYLARHPAAKDGIEGIVEWWLLEQHIVNQTAIVRAALETLVRKGWLLAQGKAGRNPMYSINPERINEARQLVSEVPYPGGPIQ